ncbi:MAG: ATP-binding protein [Gaiellaceae bacterium]
MTAAVGRDRELATIGEFLHAEHEGARVLLLEGEAGIGKTTLWRAGVEEARRRGTTVLAAAGDRSEARLSFTALRDLVGDVFDELADELPAPQRRALAVMLLREEPTGPSPSVETIAVAFLTALRALAARSPVLLAIDDVQWLDTASAAPIAYAIRRLNSADRALVLLSRRTEDERPRALGLDALEPDALRVLRAGHLSMGAIAHILNTRLGTVLPRSTLMRLHEVSGGNPYFALELARALGPMPAPLAAGTPLHVPTSLQQLLRERLEALPLETLEALTYLAAMARPSLELLGAALGREPRPALLPALGAHLVETREDDVQFEHPLLAAGVLDLASPERLREVHRRLAATLRDKEERARHLALGADGPDAAIAAALEDSAHGTSARGSRIVSAELYEAAARLTPELDARDRARRVLAAAAAWFDAGDASRAAASIEALLAEAVGGEERVAAQLLLGRILVEVGRLQDAMPLWAEALETTDDAATVADLRSSMAALSLYAASATEAIAHADEAVASARESGDTGRLAYAYAGRAMAGIAGGDASYRSLLEHALELEPADEAAGSAWNWSPTLAAAACALRAFDVDEMHLRFGALLRRGVDCGNVSLEQYGAYGLAQAELAVGNVARAGELCALAEQFVEETSVFELHVSRLRAEIDAHVGRAAEARSRLETVIAGYDRIGDRRANWLARATLGALNLADGKAGPAARELLAARELAGEIGMQDPVTLASLVDEVEAAAEADLLDQAEEALLSAQNLRIQPDWGPPLLLRANAVVAARSGRLEAADSSLARALAEATTLPLQRARTLLVLGSVQRRLRRRAAARATLQDALAGFEELGAELWAARTRDELARIGGRRSSPGELTPSERRIAGLVAEGKTNREVASILVVADRTVESALTQIYRKLDVRSRTELARKLGSVG